MAIVGSGAGGAVAATMLAEAGPRRGRAGGRPVHGPRLLPGRAPGRARRALPRRRADHRRGAARDPDPGGAGGRRHHGDQLRHLLPGARRSARALALPTTGSSGRPSSTPTTPQAEEMLHVAPVDPERMGRNGQLLTEGADALGVSHHPLARNAGRCTQCSSCPSGCRLDAKRAAHVSYLPRAVAAGARVRAGVEVEPRRLRAASGPSASADARASPGIRTGARRSRRANGDGAGRAYELRARRAVVLAGGAFGTPELLLRSGFRSPSGAAWAQPADPPRVLGRRPLRRGGARLGRRDAELRGRRVAGPGHPARGDVHAARLRRAVASGDGRRAPGADPRLRPDRLDRRPPLRPLGRPRWASPPTARCASPTS